jgi:hypothetical protein
MVNLFRRAALAVLPDRDFLPVAMPTTGVQVLQVLTRTGQVLRRYGELETVLVAGPAATGPKLLLGEAVVDATGTTSRHTHLGLGLGIVSAIIQALGGEAGLDLGATAATTVEFSYSDMAVDRVELSSLDLWLADAGFHPKLRNIADLLAADDVFVVVSALKARTVRVRLLDDRSREVSVDVPAIQAVLGASVTVRSGQGTDTSLTISGSTAVTVAVKAAQLRLDDAGLWVSEAPRTSGEVRGLADVQYLKGPELRVQPAWPTTLS